jgi:hypothetical protein
MRSFTYENIGQRVRESNLNLYEGKAKSAGTALAK